jgi:serine/threonine protein kinase
MSPDDLLVALRASLPPGYTIDGYLDRGGQGSVYSGTLAGENVAVKVFELGADRRRIDRELDLLQKMDCPYLVTVRGTADVLISGTQFSIVAYELLPGGDLRQFVQPSSPNLDWAAIVRIGKQVSTAITALWRERIVHRDIKPANIVRADDDRFVLVDVGLARHIDRSALTAIGVAPGTSGYMSPEQARGRKNLTIQSDVFSLGITLYEIAAKRHPFNRTQYLIGNIAPQPLNQSRADLPDNLARLIHQMLSPVPHQRPHDIRHRFEQMEGL